MGIDIQIYLTEVPLPPIPPSSPPFSFPSIFSLFLFFSLQSSRVLPATKTVTRNRCELPRGFGRGAWKKKNLHLARFFFLRSSILARIWNGSHADRCAHLHEVTARRRRRYYGRRFLRRKVYISRKDWCHITQGPSTRTGASKRIQWTCRFLLKCIAKSMFA